MPGETQSGDAWVCGCSPGEVCAAVVDGLGHGLYATEASAAAVAVVALGWGGPADVLQRMHGALHGTRGAAAGVARLVGGDVCFCGVGNIGATVVHLNGQRNGLPSHFGVLGEGTPRMQEFRTPWSAGARLVLHSDGMANPWRAETERGLLACHPALLAAVIYRDFVRRRDDATVLVLADGTEFRHENVGHERGVAG